MPSCHTAVRCLLAVSTVGLLAAVSVRAADEPGPIRIQSLCDKPDAGKCQLMTYDEAGKALGTETFGVPGKDGLAAWEAPNGLLRLVDADNKSRWVRRRDVLLKLNKQQPLPPSEACRVVAGTRGSNCASDR